MAERIAFSRQPARTVLVDMRQPFNPHLCGNLSESLQNVFSLVDNLSGRCRVPFFCLFAMADQPQCLYTLQHVQSGFSKLYQSIDALKSMVNRRCDGGCVARSIEQTIVQFKRQMQTLAQAPGVFPQLEITLITCQTAQAATREVESIAQNHHCESIKKITIVHVRGSDMLADHEVPENVVSPESNEATECGLIESVECAGDVLSFENFFKRWLHDSPSDQEQLHLFLPTILSKKLVLKCDVHERLLNTADLPSHHQSHLSLQVGASSAQSALAIQRGKAAAKQQESSAVLLYRLKAARLIKLQSICESVLYGQPCLVRPTTCWKMDWEELEKNQQNFFALCSLLYKRGMALLAIEDESTPKGHFLILPSDRATLLLKSIAVNELVLPYNFQPTQSRPHDDAVRLIDRSLSKLIVADGYNPLTMSSGLYASLSSASIKSTPITRPLKRKFQTPTSSSNWPISGQGSEAERPRIQTARHRPLIKPLGMKGKKSTVVSETVNSDQIEVDLFEEDLDLPIYRPYNKQPTENPKLPRKW